MVSSSAPFLCHPDLPLNGRDMFIFCDQIYQCPPCQGLYQDLQRTKLAVFMNYGNKEAMDQVIMLYPLESFGYFWDCNILQAIECCEVYLPNQRQEEWGLDNEKYVACEEYFLVQLYQSYRDIHFIPGH